MDLTVRERKLSGKKRTTSSASVSIMSESETDIELKENVSTLSTEEPPVKDLSPAKHLGDDDRRKTSAPSRTTQDDKEKPTKRRTRQKQSKPKNPQSFEENDSIVSDQDQDPESFKMVNLRDLQYQTKIERDPHHNQLRSSTHRYNKLALDEMKIRVQLFQYPLTLSKQENSQDSLNQNLKLLEERIFSWQEKVFSKSESKRYRDKKNLVTDLDFKHHDQLRDNRASVGSYLYSYVQSDKNKLPSKLQEVSPTIRRCPAKHFTGINTINNKSILEEKQRDIKSNSDDEYDSVVQIEDYGDILSQVTCFDYCYGSAGKKLRTTRKSSLEPSSSVKRKKKVKKEAKTPDGEKSKKTKKRTKAESSTNKSDSESDEENESQQSKDKKPAKTKKNPDWETDSDSDYGDATTSKGTSKMRRTRKRSGSFKHSEQSLKIYGKQSIWKPNKCDFRLDRIGRPHQFMYIMANLPSLNGLQRKIVVGSIQTYPNAGVILLRPSFGFQIIESKRNHFYRISWELYSPQQAQAQWNIPDSPRDNFKHLGSGDFQPPSMEVQERNLEMIGDNKGVLKGVGEEPPFLEQIGNIFDVVPINEFRVHIMGEIMCADGFDNSPLTLHYFLELPKGWKNEGEPGSLAGVTHSAKVNNNGVVHWCQDFCFQLGFSMDSIEENETYPRPILYLMVIYIEPKIIVRHEGYAYIPIPATPGFHPIKIQSWKLRPSTIYVKIGDVMANISPSLQDIHAVYIPTIENEECRRSNRLGLQTISSGSIQLRLHVIHHSSTLNTEQRERLQLLEKMSSATILKSVQTVIEAFQRARKKASNATTNNTL